MYSITTTQAIVLKSYDVGEKDLQLSLFTKDLGQIFARVSGIKDLKSKHRYALQDHSLVDVSLVQGKTGWRITNSNFIKSFYFETPDQKKREATLNILNLIRRFYLGEEVNTKIFDDLIFGFENIYGANSSDEIELEEAKTVGVFLKDLGYVEEEIEGRALSIQDLHKKINEGIRISGL